MDILGEKTTAGNMENGRGWHRNRWRIAAWSAAALLLLLPLLAGAPWTLSDFVFAGVLILGVGIAFELAVRKTGDAAYRAGVGVALAGAFLLTWVNAAVGITDSDADGLYLVVVAIGIIGAFVALFRPSGMASAMFATAAAQTLVGVIALVAGVVPEHNSALEILGITGFFVTLFVGSALLFREAARGAQSCSARVSPMS